MSATHAHESGRSPLPRTTSADGSSWRMLPPVRSPLAPGRLLRAAADALVGGDVVAEVERALAAGWGAEQVLLTGSGTDALTLALRAAALSSRGAVALPAYGCFDMATAAVGAACAVETYDLDVDTLSPDLASVAACVGRGATVIVVAHLYGQPADVPAVRALARSAGAIVIEDAAQAAGGRLLGEPLGSFGDLSVLSFGRGKGGSCGGGGALLVRDGSLRDAVMEAGRAVTTSRRAPGGAALASALAQWALGRPALYRLPASLPFLALGETRWTPPREPRPMAAIPLALLRLLLRDREAPGLAERRRTAGALRAALGDLQHLRWVRPVPEAEGGELRLPVIVPPPWAAGAAALGVTPGYPALLAELPQLRGRVRRGPATPGAAALVGGLVTLPTHGWVRPADVDGIRRWAEPLAEDVAAAGRAAHAPRPRDRQGALRG